MLMIDATNLPQVMNCPGWLFMPVVLPQDDDPTARNEGTAAHWVAQQIFAGHAVAPDMKAPNGFVITSEMIDHVSGYLSALDCGQMEVKTTFGNLDQNWQVNARADHVVYLRGIPDELTIDDFKYGWRLVEPVMNWTLIAHAIGYCLNQQITPSVIVLRIHQPRPYHPEGPLREWRINYTQLMEFYRQINAALSNPSQELRTGSHCAKCHALPTCPAARLASMNAIDATEMAFSDDLSPDVLSHELDILRMASVMVKTRLEALEELATHKIKTGQPMPNYSVQMRYGDTRFKTGIDAPMIKALTGIDCTKAGTVTATEALRRAKGNEPATAAMKALTERPMIGTKLVRIEADQLARKLLKK